MNYARTKPKQSLGLAETLYYFKQICDGLSHAHACGVIHRDLKPDNLLLSADSRTIKIADFGVAKSTEAEYSPITRVGTPTYSAPEHSPHLMTEVMGPLTASADIYSLAKTCYTMLCGRVPFEFNGKPITVIRKIALVEQHLKTIEKEIQSLEASDLYKLRSKAEEAENERRDLLGEMEAQVENQIDEAKGRLERILQTRLAL